MMLGISILAGAISSVPAFAKEKITLRALLVEPSDRWEKTLIPMALAEFNGKVS